MKKIMLAMFFLFASQVIFSAEYCPENIFVPNEKVGAPLGWHITYKILNGISDAAKHTPGGKVKFLFYIAVYNYDHSGDKGHENNNHISCIYKDRRDHYQVEITTDKEGYPQPTEGQWNELEDHLILCAPAKPLEVKDCPW